MSKEQWLPEELSATQEKLVFGLFRIGAIRFGDFKLALHEEKPDAPLSPVYVDLRRLRRFPEVKQLAVRIYEELVFPLAYDLFADVPTGATPLVSSLSDKLKVGMITPRIDKKTHGGKSRIDGFLESDRGKTVVVFEDTMSTGESTSEAINFLIGEGVVVRDVVVLMDREQGNNKLMAELGCNLHVGFKLKQILVFYRERNFIDELTYEKTLRGLGKLNEFLGRQA